MAHRPDRVFQPHEGGVHVFELDGGQIGRVRVQRRFHAVGRELRAARRGARPRPRSGAVGEQRPHAGRALQEGVDVLDLGGDARDLLVGSADRADGREGRDGLLEVVEEVGAVGRHPAARPPQDGHDAAHKTHQVRAAATCGSATGAAGAGACDGDHSRPVWSTALRAANYPECNIEEREPE